MTATTTPIRQCRERLGLSQAAFASLLGVPSETYRTWDSGRRSPPAGLIIRAQVLAGCPDDTKLLPMYVLATMIGVHRRTLQAAARAGRLSVVYDTRTTFRRLRPQATLASALVFRRDYYGRQRPAVRPAALPTWAVVPEDYDVRIRATRQRLDVSQSQFAGIIGAAGKAVVYQWEARKRVPSPVFWQRMQAIADEERAPG